MWAVLSDDKGDHVLLFVGSAADHAAVSHVAADHGLDKEGSLTLGVECVVVGDSIVDGRCSADDCAVLSSACTAGIRVVGMHDLREVLENWAARPDLGRPRVSLNPVLHGMRIIDSTL